MLAEAGVAIVGAGPAGLAATIAAGEAGCGVTLIDVYRRVGGQYFKQGRSDLGIANMDMLSRRRREASRQLFARVERLPRLTLLAETSVWAAQAAPDGGAVLYVHGPAGAGQIRARSVILATGAYDRTLPFPGWDLPGVMTLGAAQTLVKSEGVLPGRRIVLAGSGPFLLPVAAAIVQAGGVVAAVCEATAPRQWARYAPQLWGQWGKIGEARDYLRQLLGHVPLFFGHAAVRVDGSQRVERVVRARLQRDWSPVAGSDVTVDADALCIGYGFMPSTELAYALGCAKRFEPRLRAFVPRHDGDMLTSVAGVYVAGEMTGIGGAEQALAQGSIAGLAAARGLGLVSQAATAARMAPFRRRLERQQRFAALLSHLFSPGAGWMRWMTPDTMICRCEDVTLGQIVRAVDNYGAHDVKTLKLVTRCGMGYCQGRMCDYAVNSVVASLSGRRAEEAGTFAGRPIARPVPLGEVV